MVVNQTADWSEAPLSEVVRPEASIGYGIVQVGLNTRDGIPVIAIRDLPIPTTEKTHHSSLAIEAAYRRSRVTTGDVLISVKGTAGRIGMVPHGFEGNISRDVARIRLNDDHTPPFWFQLLQSSIAQHTIQKAVVGTTRHELSIGILAGLRFRFPTKDEQERIAAPLTETDDLIAAIERLIAKKRAIKRGMMQELLTGRTRLPGFEEPWQESAVGNLALVVGGGTPSTQVAEYWGGGIPWFTPAEIDSAGSGIVTNSERSISQLGLRSSSAHMLPSGSVLVTSRASIGNCAVAGVSVTTNQGFTSLVPTSPKSTWFLYYWVQQNKPEFESRAAGSTFVEISPRKVQAIPILAPSLDEQSSIGAILQDADAEIAALERRLRATRAIKQGMMQELLTGRTRLLVEVAI